MEGTKNLLYCSMHYYLIHTLLNFELCNVNIPQRKESRFMFGVSSYSGFYGNTKIEANCGSYIAVLSTSTVTGYPGRCSLPVWQSHWARCKKDCAGSKFIRNLKTKIEKPLFQFHVISRNRSCALWEEQGRNSTKLMPWNCQLNVACVVQFGLPEKFLRTAVLPQMSFSLKRSGSWKPRRNWSWCPPVTPSLLQQPFERV